MSYSTTKPGVFHRDGACGSGTAALAGLVMAALLVPASALAQQKSLYVRGSVGVAQQTLSGWNNSTRVEGLPLNFRGLGAATSAGVEAGYRFHGAVSAGVGLTSQKSSTHHAFADKTLKTTGSTDATLSLVALYGTASIWLRGDDGFYLSEQIGMISGKADAAIAFRDTLSRPQLLVDERGSWHRLWWMLGVAAGYERHFTRGPLVYAEVGLRYQDLGDMDGTLSGIASRPRLGPLRDGDQNMITDFSGVRGVIGLGYRLRIR